MKTLREILLDAGMKKEELDNHCGDLYVKVNEISKKIINNYEFKNNVTTFTDDIEHKLWYDIPFGFSNEYYFITKENSCLYKIFKYMVSFDIFKKDLLQNFSLKNSKKIISTLEKQIGNREKSILNNYSKMALEEKVILIVYDNKGNTFGIDTRTEENTFGNIVE